MVCLQFVLICQPDIQGHEAPHHHQDGLSESRQDQEEGAELDSHEEAIPEEIKSREVVLG